MNDIRGIIFDKDGTLFDYGKVWGPVIHDAIVETIDRSRISPEKKTECIASFMRLIGVDEKGITYPDGIIFRHDKLCRAVARALIMTLHFRLNPILIAKGFYKMLNKDDYGLRERLENMEFPGVREVIENAYRKGYVLGVVTNDTEKSTKVFLDTMRISAYISFIRTKDSPTLRKPNPTAIKEFCSEFGMESRNIAIIGDSVVDMEFASLGKAGYAVAVLTGSRDLEGLEKSADAIYPTLGEILNDPVLFPKR